MAEALYRKYRPQVFSEVVGQDHIERTIKNAIEQDKLSHAYLFCGPRGTGKTTTARLLAKALLCENGPTPNPDGTCDSCLEIANGEHPDVYELDAASRTGVENVREEIISRVQFAPTRGKYKVYIIDEVHMLSTAAFNALLKTLEEPPAHVVFVLCTTDPQKVPETILSRCQRFDFRRIDSQGMTDRLEQICQAEGVTFEREALEVIASRSDGGLRNALTALEQAIAFGEGTVSVAVVQQLGGTQAACDVTEAINALASRDIAAAFLWVDTFAQTGGDFARLTADLAQRVRDMYFLAMAGTKAPLSVAEEMRGQIIAQAKRFSPDRLAYMLETLGDVMVQLKQATNARLCFEIALTKICHPQSDVTLESLAERVDALEKRPVAMAAKETLPARDAHAFREGNVVSQLGAAPVAATDRPVVSQSAGEWQTSAPVAAAKLDGEQSAGRRIIEQQVVAIQSETASEQTAADSVALVTETRPAAPVSQAAPAATAVRPTAKRSMVSNTVANESSRPAASASGVSASSAPAKKLEGFANPAIVQRMWQRCLAEIKRDRPAYTSLLMSASVAYDQASASLNVTFRQGYAFALTMMQKPEALEYLREAVTRVAGASVPVVVAAEASASVSSPVGDSISALATLPAVSPSAEASAASSSATQVSRNNDAASTAAPERSIREFAATSPTRVEKTSKEESSEVSIDAATHATPGWTPDGNPAARYPEGGAGPAGDSAYASAGDARDSHAAAEDAYAYEEVPLDAYDDFSAYDYDEKPPFEQDVSLDQQSYDAGAYDADNGGAASSVASVAVQGSASAASKNDAPVGLRGTAEKKGSATEVPPWEDDPFALPDDEPTMELDEFQQMLVQSFGVGVVVEEA